MKSKLSLISRVDIGDRLFDYVNNAFMAIVLIIIAYPLYFTIIASFTDPHIVNNGGILLLPVAPYLKGYQKIFNYAPLWNGYKNSIIYMTVGTAINLAVTIPCAYAVSRRDLPGRNAIMFLFTFTMFFSGGLIPSYMLVMKLGMMDNIWGMVLPNAASVMNIIITRTFFQSTIPDELRESSVIDGCTNFQFFFRIVLPLSKVIIAVMTLFYAVGHWNSYFQALLYINSEKRYPLQIVLRNLLIINTIGNTSMGVDVTDLGERVKIMEQLKYGVIVVSSLPLMIAYPLLQKYFTKGVMIGAIKG